VRSRRGNQNVVVAVVGAKAVVVAVKFVVVAVVSAKPSW
jgi:hypothetical protein